MKGVYRLPPGGKVFCRNVRKVVGKLYPGDFTDVFFIYVVIFDITTIARYNKSIYLIKYLFDS